ncbi:MAG: hypothetical protein LBT26_10530 [Clostridiales Family XIII bacterium]|jgi:citrate lyase beta subunit|nr:hypothetical protein [Clostridiales Family XIII bacterium]
MKSILIVDASNPNMLLNAPLYGADAVLFDLTKTAPDERDATRILLEEALSFFDYSAIDVLVQVNAETADLVADIRAVCAARPKAVVLPSAEAADMKQAAAALSGAERDAGLPDGSIGLAVHIAAGGTFAQALAALNASGRDTLIIAGPDASPGVYPPSIIAATHFPPGTLTKESLFAAKTAGFGAAATEDARAIDLIHTVFQQNESPAIGRAQPYDGGYA